jgi:polyisoprenyl-phosphate glycosyltransferase
VVIPVLNEEQNLAALYQQLVASLEGIGDDFELIFVDDGSTDRSVEEISSLHRRDARVKLICLSRNFGHQHALTAGMDYARGDAVIMMDADLQHPPSVIVELIRRWTEGFEVVYTVRDLTKEAGPLKRVSASLFYRLFRALSSVNLPANAADFRLLDRKVIDAFGRIRERTRFLRGLTSWVGYRSIAVPYRAPARHSGRSKYGFKRMFRFAVDGLVSFSATPLYVAIFVGLLLAIAGLGYFLYVLYSRLVIRSALPGWTSIIVIVMLIGGLQLSLMGIIGIYIGRIYEETKRRPLYLVTRRIGFPDSTATFEERHLKADS